VSTSSRGDSPASPCPSPDDSEARTTNGGCGRPWRTSFASYDPDGCCWRTSQGSLFGGLETFSGTWPRAGMTRSGTAYRLPPSAPLTAATESGSLPTPRATDGERGGRGDLLAQVRTGLDSRRKNWPTPTATNTKAVHLRSAGRPPRSYLPTPTARLGDPKRGSPSPELALGRYLAGRRNLEDAVAMWPTPTASDATGGPAYSKPPGREGGFLLKETVRGGPLNPTWVEWLMGYPAGWTDCGPSATP
jgi:hypothetical protein